MEDSVRLDLYNQVEKEVKKYIRSKFSNKDVEDRVSIALIDVWKFLPGFNPEHPRANLKLYALAAAKRSILSSIKGEPKEDTTLDRTIPNSDELYSELIPSPEEDNPLKETFNFLLSKLSETDREVIKLHDYEGYSLSEIAKGEGCSEAIIQKRRYRALQKLKEIIYAQAGLYSGAKGSSKGSDREVLYSLL